MAIINFLGHSFYKNVLSTYYVSDLGLTAGYTVVNKSLLLKS